MDSETEADAREALRDREGVLQRNEQSHIGSWAVGRPAAPIQGLDAWARTRQLDGVVWTALPPKFGNAEVMPSIEEVISHLRSLTGAKRDEAERYVRRTPRQIDTNYRRRIENEFGWTPRDG
jgi:hypothetical protein